MTLISIIVYLLIEEIDIDTAKKFLFLLSDSVPITDTVTIGSFQNLTSKIVNTVISRICGELSWTISISSNYSHLRKCLNA
jgi:hypothetical protein